MQTTLIVTLTSNGEKYSFSLKIRSGGRRLCLSNSGSAVTNYTKLSDIDGVYTAVEVWCGGREWVRYDYHEEPAWNNDDVTGVQERAQLKLAAGGVKVDLKG